MANQITPLELHSLLEEGEVMWTGAGGGSKEELREERGQEVD